ncbi:MAG: outer membrane beta-barrel protein [Candidatus Aminicenantes bacterium]|nr:outer membrane beta-barrel protein [Candidatus Aminicenantes bacterium]
MKKIISVLLFLLLAGGAAQAMDFMIGAKAHYMHPSDEMFREVYGGGFMFGGGLGVRIINLVEIWVDGSYFSKTGELTYTGEETKITLFPIGVEGRVFLPLSVVKLYGGAGLAYYNFKESNILGEVEKSALGVRFKAGVVIELPVKLSIDVFGGYSLCKMTPVAIEIDVGGIEAGLGLRYGF